MWNEKYAIMEYYLYVVVLENIDISYVSITIHGFNLL